MNRGSYIHTETLPRSPLALLNGTGRRDGGERARPLVWERQCKSVSARRAPRPTQAAIGRWFEPIGVRLESRKQNGGRLIPALCTRQRILHANASRQASLLGASSAKNAKQDLINKKLNKYYFFEQKYFQEEKIVNIGQYTYIVILYIY